MIFSKEWFARQAVTDEIQILFPGVSMSTVKHVLHVATVLATGAVAFLPQFAAQVPGAAHIVAIVGSVAAAITYLAHLLGADVTETTTTGN